jgi:CHAT domain-containing protein
LLSGCHRVTARSQPEATYEQIRGLFLRGELPDAREEAHTSWLQQRTADPLKAWPLLVLEAEIRDAQGRFPDALALLKDQQPPAGIAKEFLTRRWMIEARAHSGQGESAEAAKGLKRAQALCPDTGCPQRGELLGLYGVVDVDNGNLDDAEAAFQQSLGLARHDGDKYLESKALSNLGVVALRREHFDQALQWLQSSTDLARNIHARLLLERNLGNIGWAYHEMGDYERALASYQQAGDEAEKLNVTWDQVTWLAAAGQDTWNLGDLKQAIQLHERALVLAESIHDASDTAAIQVNLAYLAFESGNLDTARKYAAAALNTAQPIHDQRAELDLKTLQGAIADRTGDRENALQTLLEVDAEASTFPDLRWDVEDRIASIHAERNDSVAAEAWYKKSIDTFEAQRPSVASEDSSLPFFANGDQLYSDYADYLIGQRKPREALRLLDFGRARTLEAGLGVASKVPHSLFENNIDPKTVSRKLDGTILSYWLGPHESWLWAINGSQVSFFRLPPKAEIANRVHSYSRAILSSSDVLNTKNENGLALYNMLIAPARAMIPNGSKVFVIADGSLDELNFETLIVPASKPHFWIEDVTVTNVDSLRMLNAFASHRSVRTSPNLLLIGNPVSPGEEYEDLPNAPKELQSIEDHFPVSRRLVLTGKQAVPAAYNASGPENFSYIHFVAHGMASRLSPLDSAVVLSRTAGDPDTFKLYARDIIHRRLHADLVTISACYGSGSREYAGEGLIGLSWAFVRAGSHYVIGALWQVNDASTPRLMNRLYDELARDRSPDAALRDAKLSLIHAQSVYRKPLYWATFQLYGGV